MRPLARWIIGNVKPKGFDCLEYAVSSFKNIYPQFDLLICHNQIENISKLENMGIPLFEQIYTNEFCEPKGVAWKLYPPRLRLESHEIVMDNDLIITQKMPQIDEFLNVSDHVLFYESTKRDYGNFEKFVPANFYLNSGIYGMPPNFDFAGKIKGLFAQSGLKEWTNSCNQGRYTWDEQGIVAAALSNCTKRIKISLSQISNCEIDLLDGIGYHFVGINRYTKQKPWRDWLEKQNKLLL